MTRTIITIDKDEKAWLMHQAKRENVSMAEVIREAIRAHRKRMDSKTTTDFNTLLMNTRGIWKHGDGLVYQNKIRSEWE